MRSVRAIGIVGGSGGRRDDATGKSSQNGHRYVGSMSEGEGRGGRSFRSSNDYCFLVGGASRRVGAGINCQLLARVNFRRIGTEGEALPSPGGNRGTQGHKDVGAGKGNSSR